MDILKYQMRVYKTFQQIINFNMTLVLWILNDNNQKKIYFFFFGKLWKNFMISVKSISKLWQVNAEFHYDGKKNVKVVRFFFLL